MVVLPVFNEANALPAVLEEWMPAFEAAVPDFRLLALDDGSTDSTPRLLEQAASKFSPRLEWRRHPNRGHGQTCLEGCRAACQAGAEWVFQLDSDGQCDARFFKGVWESRGAADVVYGVRVSREDGWRRVLASRVLRLVLLVVARTSCADANTPYRLMRVEGLAPALDRIPADFRLANIALAVVLKRMGWREAHVPIAFRARAGGEPSVPLRLFAARALELIRQLRSLP
ncbi:MAG: glycosyltransferase family 2 protein [Terrimicrobiaceae bacterium]|nr:glycosyltransferase family 2 protein [Terrimicrobiaceae bacterium]